MQHCSQCAAICAFGLLPVATQADLADGIRAYNNASGAAAMKEPGAGAGRRPSGPIVTRVDV